MMKQKSLLLIPILALCAFTASFAQNADYRSTISVTAGANIFQIIARLDDPISDSLGGEVKLKATASYGLNYDYGVNNWFSIGLATGFNRISLNSPNIEVDKGDGTVYTGPIDLKVTRTNIALRPLFHYGNKGRIDMYSGLRVGLNIWSVKLTADEALNPDDVSGRLSSAGLTPNFQIIPFGLRGYITPNIGLGFEFGIGGPHYAALQLNYRM
jgi:hypothetical protein